MQDKYGLVPPSIRHDYERAEMVDRSLAAAIAIHAALVDIDPRLDLVFISDRADPEYGVVPGRWHVVRHNDPPTPDSYIPITTREGGYRDPDSGVLDEVKRRDTWRTGIEPHLGPSEGKKTNLREQLLDDAKVDVKAAARVAGDGGMERRKWGRK